MNSHQIVDSAPNKSSACTWVTNLFKNTYNNIRYYYMNSPINGSVFTGLRYPHLPRLKGNYWHSFADGMLRKFASKNGIGAIEGMIEAGKLADQHESGIAYYWIAHKCNIVLTHPSAIHQFFINQKKFSRSDATKFNFAQGFGFHNVFTTQSRLSDGKKNPEWENQKHLFVNILQNVNLNNHLPKPIAEIIDNVYSQMDEKLLASKHQQIDVELEEFSTQLTMAVGSKALLGVPLNNDFEKHIAEFTVAFDDLLKEIFDHQNYGKKVVSDIKLKLGLSSLESKTEIAKQKLTELTKKYYLEPNKQHILNSDNLIKSLAKLDPVNQGKEEKDFKLDTPNMLDQINFALLAGHDTSARLVQFLIMYLASNQKLIEQLRDEIAQNPPEEKYYNSREIKKMKLLTSCIQEVERLHPGAPITGYVAAEDVVFGDLHKDWKHASDFNNTWERRDVTRDILIKKGSFVIIPIHTIQRSKRYYGEDAEDFNPHRPKQNKFAFFPFGNGDRSCPAFEYAPYEAAVAIIKLIQKYDFNIDVKPPFETTLLGTTRHLGPVKLTLTPHKLDAKLESRKLSL